MEISYLEGRRNGLTEVDVYKGRALILKIRHRFDHTGNGRHWEVVGGTVRGRYHSIDLAKSAVRRWFGK
jgi:hypothetical protein